MKEFEIIYKVTKETILEKLSEEQIFNYYLAEFGIKVSLDNKHFKNPLRNDVDAGCNFGRAKKSNKLLLFDWAYKIYSCFDFVMYKYNVSFGDTLKIIDKDSDKIKEYSTTSLLYNKPIINNYVKNKNNKPKEIRIKRKLFSKKELEFWAVEGLNISPQTLQKNKIYAIEAYSIDESYFKIENIGFAYHWNKYNYQLYFPFGINSKIKNKFIISAELTVGDEEFLNPKANHLVITKSKKDAFYLRQFGLNANFIVREKTLLDPFTMAEYKKQYSTIFLLGDNDYTGIKFLKMYRKEYPDIICLFFNKKIYKKDFTDNLKFFGVQKMKELIQSTLIKYNLT